MQTACGDFEQFVFLKVEFNSGNVNKYEFWGNEYRILGWLSLKGFLGDKKACFGVLSGI